MARYQSMRGQSCWLCGRNGTADPLDKHHIFGGSNRTKSERLGLVVPLCHSRCHENGPEAVHRNGETMQALHEYGQKLAMERFGWTIEEFRLEFGRNYLPLDWKPEEEEEGFFLLDDEEDIA